MTTTAEAIEEFARFVGLTQTRVTLTAKALRAGGSDLWPTGGRGGGKVAARVEAAHLRNLLIASLASEQLADSAQVSRTFSSLRGSDPGGLVGVDKRAQWRTDPELKAVKFPKGPNLTFGDWIDALIEAHLDAKQHPALSAIPLVIEVCRNRPLAKIYSITAGNIQFFRHPGWPSELRPPSPLDVWARVNADVCAVFAGMLSRAAPQGARTNA